MKKYIALLLIAAAFMTACSSADSETEPETETTAETEVQTETEPETEMETFEMMDSFNFYRLETAEQPVFEDDILIVRFTEDDIKYSKDSVFYIGIKGSDSAYTIKGTSQIDLYPEMITNPDKNYHSGVALIPSAEIPAGDYKMSVTFESFICEFDITVK